MTTIHTTSLVRRRPGRGVLALALCLPIALAGCSSLLDVNNPNSVPIEDIGDPKTAPSLANGLLSSLARAWGAVLSPYSIATDELTWIGSRDAWQYLDQGIISEPTNEFVDAAYPFLGESRWLSDTVIKQLTIFLNNTRLEDTNNLARAYLYGSITYATIGDFFQDFVIGSSKLKPAPPLGPANMDVVYATAISYATAGLALARAASNRDVDLETRLLAARARAAHARAVKALIYPPGAGVPIGGNPLVNNAAARADAESALAIAPVADWKFEFHYSPTTVSTDIGFEINERLEMMPGDRYVNAATWCGDLPATPADITLQDPIDNIPDPAMLSQIKGRWDCFGDRYTSLTALSARELHLIVAEVKLAQGDLPGFDASINNVRSLNGLTNYDHTNPAHPTPSAILQHERQANLYLQGRRLQDEYRFQVPADIWLAGSEALTVPGTLFPITITERLSNTCIVNPSSC